VCNFISIQQINLLTLKVWPLKCYVGLIESRPESIALCFFGGRRAIGFHIVALESIVHAVYKKTETTCTLHCELWQVEIAVLWRPMSERGCNQVMYISEEIVFFGPPGSQTALVIGERGKHPGKMDRDNESK
jgi:hypothetical protein